MNPTSPAGTANTERCAQRPISAHEDCAATKPKEQFRHDFRVWDGTKFVECHIFLTEADISQLARSLAIKRPSALDIFLSPNYHFEDQPENARRIAQAQDECLRFMDTEPTLLSKAKSISERSKKALTLAALEAMADLNAQRQDSLIYLRLLGSVTHEVQDPEQPDTTIGVVSRGRAVEPQDLFPGLTDDQLRYRMKEACLRWPIDPQENREWLPPRDQILQRFEVETRLAGQHRALRMAT